MIQHKFITKSIALFSALLLLTTASPVYAADIDATGVAPMTPAQEVTIMAVGDNLMHMGVVRTGDQGNGTYNYDFLFTQIAPYLQAADIKIINQETPMAGNNLGFSGYPAFNSPTEVGDAIVNAGFNVITQATNHALDRGKNGLISNAAYWHNSHPEVILAGIHEEPPTEPCIPTMEVNGITFAILNYTYGPNFESFPTSLDGYLDLLCNVNESSRTIDFTTINPKVLDEIALADSIADVVIVCPHWGVEYQTSPSKYQKMFAEQMVEAGADLIIGTHPHVPQPVEWVESPNGNTALCYYSLGNYVSTQKGPQSMLEELAWITIKQERGKFVVVPEKTGVVPLVNYYTFPVRSQGTYPLSQFTEEMSNNHGILGYGGVRLIHSDLVKWTEQIMGDMVYDPFGY